MVNSPNDQKRIRTVEFVGSLLLFLIPLTISGMGILWKCVVWAVCWLLVIHLISSIGFLREMWWPRKLILFVLATAVLVVLVYDPIYDKWRSEKAALTSGVLHPLINNGQALPAIQVGQSEGLIYLTDPKGYLFNFPSDSIRVREERGELLFSTTVRDHNGNLVVEIVDNHWTVSPLTTNCWDKNYTSDSLEVKDGRGRVVLQVRILADRVQLQGEWPTSNNTLVQEYDERTGIVPRFKYPSSEHLGETLY